MKISLQEQRLMFIDLFLFVEFDCYNTLLNKFFFLPNWRDIFSRYALQQEKYLGKKFKKIFPNI